MKILFEFFRREDNASVRNKNIIVRDRAIYKYGIETWISALASILLLLVVGIIFNCILEVTI
ncbi:MAG: accessory gene regulator B family protein [Streptococcus sp.]